MRRRKADKVAIQVRMKEPLRALIEHSARDRGVSMNAEMVTRLEHSFDNADLPPSVFGGGDNVILAMLIGSIMRTVKDQLGAQTLADPYALPATEAGIYQFFRTLREALPDQMKLDDPRVGAGIAAGRKVADVLVAIMRDRAHASGELVPVDDVEELRALMALRFSKWTEKTNVE